MFPRRQIWFQKRKTLQVHEYQHKYTLVTVSFMKVDMEEEKKQIVYCQEETGNVVQEACYVNVLDFMDHNDMSHTSCNICSIY